MNRFYTFLLVLFSVLGGVKFCLAQETLQSQDNQEKTAIEEAKAEQPQRINPTSNNVFKLEETIRVNKEQPQVLTIVPWQLPRHKRVDANTDWFEITDTIAPISRTQFLRNVKVVDEILTTTK